MVFIGELVFIAPFFIDGLSVFDLPFVGLGAIFVLFPFWIPLSFDYVGFAVVGFDGTTPFASITNTKFRDGVVDLLDDDCFLYRSIFYGTHQN